MTTYRPRSTASGRNEGCRPLAEGVCGVQDAAALTSLQTRSAPAAVLPIHDDDRPGLGGCRVYLPPAAQAAGFQCGGYRVGEGEPAMKISNHRSAGQGSSFLYTRQLGDDVRRVDAQPNGWVVFGSASSRTHDLHILFYLAGTLNM